MTRLCLLACFLILTAGCSTIHVAADYNPRTDFSGLKTYAWVNDAESASKDVRVNNKLVIQSVRSAIEADLDSKGFTKTVPEQADCLVAWFGAIEEKVKTENINHFYKRYGYGTLYQDPYWNSQPTVISQKEYEEGRLIVDFVDPDSDTLIWRGIGKDKVVKGRSDEQVRKNLGEAVKKILADFPPK